MESRAKLIKLKRANSFSLLILFISSISLLSNCSKGSIGFTQKHPFEAISSTNSLFIYFPKASSILEGVSEPVFAELIEKIPAFFNMLSVLESLYLADGEQLSDAVYVIQGIGAGKLGGTLILNGLNTKKIAYNSLGWRQNGTSQFRGRQIIQIQNVDKANFAISQFDNLTLIAEYPYQIEDAIVQLTDQKASILQSPSFQVLPKDGAQNWASIFINPEFSKDFLSNFLKDEAIKRTNNWSAVLSWCKIDLQKDGAILGNINLTAPYDLLFSNSLNAESLSDILTILPSTISYLEHHQVNWKHYIKEYPTISSWFSTYFLQWISNSYAFVQTSTGRTDGELDEFIVLKSTSETLKEQGLDQFLNETGLLQSFEYQTFQIQQAIHNNLLEPFVVTTNKVLKNPYLVCIEDYVIIASSKAGIELWIDQYIVGNTLINAPKFVNNMPVSSKALEQFYYVDSKQLDLILESWLKDGDNEFYTFINAILKPLDQVALNLKEDKSFNLYQTKSLVQDKQHRVLWKCQLEAEAVIAPKLISFEEGAALITLIQDNANTLYAIDPGGQVIWTKVLDSPVLSEFHSMDYYEDGTIELLFNTKEKIYLIDKNGKDVSPFPIRLLSRASNGLQVVDFYETGAFTFFLGSANGNIYGFDKQGRPFPGWNPMRDVGVITNPLLHFQFQHKDYLALYTSDRVLKVFKQDGTYRFPPVRIEKELVAAPRFQVSESTARIVLCHADASATIIPPNGEVFGIRFEGMQGTDAFVFQDILGDKRYDYLTLDDTLLALYYYEANNFKRAWKQQLSNPIDSLFVLSKSSTLNQPYIGVLDQRKQQINLLDTSGTLQSGFPLAGSTPFELYDLGVEGSKALVVGFGEEVYCYQIAKNSGGSGKEQ